MTSTSSPTSAPHAMASAALKPALSESRRAVVRDDAIDFTKGVLVLFMVLYHWLNYFIAPSGHFFNYLRFLTPSFIFITGFVVSNIQISKYGADLSRLSGRLLVRGLKIVGIYAGLNFLISLVFPGSLVKEAFTASALPTTLSAIATGNSLVQGDQKSASFNILVPIAYLLLVSSALVPLYRHVKYVFHYACGICLVAIGLLGFYGMGSVNLELLMVGLLGVVFGFATREQITAVIGRSGVIAGLYLVYLAFITIGDVNLPVQTIGTVLTMIAIYALGQRDRGYGVLGNRAVLLGKYSLFAYIVQIAILQVARRGLRTAEESVILTTTILLGFSGTLALVDMVHWVRSKSKAVNQLYGVVFG